MKIHPQLKKIIGDYKCPFCKKELSYNPPTSEYCFDCGFYLILNWDLNYYDQIKIILSDDLKIYLYFDDKKMEIFNTVGDFILDCDLPKFTIWNKEYIYNKIQTLLNFQ